MAKKPYRLPAGIFLLFFIFACNAKDPFSYELIPDEAHKILAVENKTGNEPLWHYLFDTGSGNTEWVILSSKGFYDASEGGAFYITIETRKKNYFLDQFSEILYRPDIIHALLTGQEASEAPDLKTILSEEKNAPTLNVTLTGQTLYVTVSDEGGGAGTLVLFQRDNYGRDTAIALYDTISSAKNTYKKNRKDHYELEILVEPLWGLETQVYAVSVFNAGHTMESERVFVEQKETVYETKPNMHFISHDENWTNALEPLIKKDDFNFFCLPSPEGIDDKGDFVFSSFTKWSLLDSIFKIKAQNTAVFINSNEGVETWVSSLARLQKWLGPQRLVFMLPYTAIDDFFEDNPDTQFISTADLAAYTFTGNSFLPESISSIAISRPYDARFIANFPLLERSSTEERGASQSGSWSSFNYSSDLLSIINQARLNQGAGGFRVFIDELSPSNYNRVDAPVLIEMGMEQHYVSLLEGNKFYEAGDYDRAIAEYNKAINLKSDYADAYAWRGNAYRRKGENSRAIDDYTMALRYKSNYPEVYNYRGYLYAQNSDYTRAIADYTQALRFRADYADALFNRAYAYGRSSDYQRAIDDLTRLIRLESNNAFAYNERGKAWQALGNYERAEADFAAADRLNRGRN